MHRHGLDTYRIPARSAVACLDFRQRACRRKGCRFGVEASGAYALKGGEFDYVTNKVPSHPAGPREVRRSDMVDGVLAAEWPCGRAMRSPHRSSSNTSKSSRNDLSAPCATQPASSGERACGIATRLINTLSSLQASFIETVRCSVWLV
jgi:hypothetical protein